MKKRGLLLDRDGVINEDYDYVGTIDRFAFRPGIFRFLSRAQDLGYRLIVVTNQAGVGRGYYTRQDYEALTAHMKERLAEVDVKLDLVLESYVYKESQDASLARESFWRKPNPGMMLEAALRLDLDLARSVMVGDRETDMMAASAAGVGSLYMIGGEAGKFAGVKEVDCFQKIDL